MADKTLVIVQSSYIPWKGYFDLMARADELVLLDTVQFTRRDWRTRNRIKTPDGAQWLTVPVAVKGRYEQKINEVRVADPGWAGKHWQRLRHAYARAACFTDCAAAVEGWYGRAGELERLSDVNRLFIDEVRALLGIDTPISRAEDYPDADDPTERLLGICRAAGATVYLSGPSARDYLDEGPFAAAGIAVQYMDYSGYPEYRQLYGEFRHDVTVLDLIFNEGADAPRFMKAAATP